MSLLIIKTLKITWGRLFKTIKLNLHRIGLGNYEYIFPFPDMNLAS